MNQAIPAILWSGAIAAGCAALIIAGGWLLSAIPRWLTTDEKRAACLRGECSGPTCWCGGEP